MATMNTSPETLLNEHDVARITRLSLTSVRRWRLLGQGPKYLKLEAAFGPPGRRAMTERQPTQRDRALKRGANELMALCQWALRDRPRTLKQAQRRYTKLCVSLYQAIAARWPDGH